MVNFEERDQSSSDHEDCEFDDKAYPKHVKENKKKKKKIKEKSLKEKGKEKQEKKRMRISVSEFEEKYELVDYGLYDMDLPESTDDAMELLKKYMTYVPEKELKELEDERRAYDLKMIDRGIKRAQLLEKQTKLILKGTKAFRAYQSREQQQH